MKGGNDRASAGRQTGHVSPRRVRLPGFLVDDDTGLGDVIKRATRIVGLAPCGGCAQRAIQLNRAVVFIARH